MKMATYVNIEIDIDEYLDEVSTAALKREIATRGNERDGEVSVSVSLAEPPAHTIYDLKKSYESQNPHEFYYLVRKIEMMLEDIDAQPS